MPNWCNNFIIIEPNENDKKLKKFNKLVKRISITAKSSTQFCESLLGLKKAPKNYHQGGWYDYNISRWGTKWDFEVSNDEINYDTHQISFSKETAWSPPINFLIELCERYGVNAKIEFEEGGCDFAGIVSINPEGIYEDISYDSVAEFNYNHNDSFWENAQSYAEDLDFEETSLSDFIGWYPFVKDENGIKELEEIYNNAKSYSEAEK